jgi:hypothetical protein
MPYSYEKYFEQFSLRHKFIGTFYSRLQRSLLVGAPVNLYFTHLQIPVLFSLLLKSGYYHYFRQFVPVFMYEGICVSHRKRQFGSSVKIRLVDDGFLVERFVLLFSPRLINIAYKKTSLSHLVSKKRFKSKLYFLKAQSQRRLFSWLYS